MPVRLIKYLPVLVLFIYVFNCKHQAVKTANRPEVLFFMVEFNDRIFPASRSKDYYQDLLVSGSRSLQKWVSSASLNRFNPLVTVTGPARVDMNIKDASYRVSHGDDPAKIERVINLLLRKTKLKQAFERSDHVGLILPAANHETMNHYHTGPTPLMVLNTTARKGEFAHELGHALGLPDLYDHEQAQTGIGAYSLMADGYRLGNSEKPALFDAYCRLQKGWMNLQTVPAFPAEITLASASLTGHVLLLPLGDNTADNHVADEILVEYRTRQGLDTSLPAAALLAYRVTRYSRVHDTVESAGRLQAPQAGMFLKAGPYHLGIKKVGNDGITLLLQK